MGPAQHGAAERGVADSERAVRAGGDGGHAAGTLTAGVWRPQSQDDLAPSGEVARVRANIAAIATVRALEDENRPATDAERQVLARWSGWGAVPAVFDEGARAHESLAWAREQLKGLLRPDELAAARRSTINAHYTDAAYVREVWGAVDALGFRGGRVLEPGCGSGTFIGLAPDAARCTGVELEPMTARIARALYPQAEIRSESFADTRAPSSSYDLVVGNVPFGNVSLHDPRHNAGGHAIHNHFILKSLDLTKPGGLVAVLTSRYTLDAQNPAARREMAELADLVGAVRLPTGAHARAAGTDVVTDLLLFRRREPGRPPAGEAFERAQALDGAGGASGVRMNEYFGAHPDHVLGRVEVTQGEAGRPELAVVGQRAAGPALNDALAGIVREARERGLTFDAAGGDVAPEAVARVPESANRPVGYITAQPDGTFTRRLEAGDAPYEPPRSQVAELRSLLQLRDTQVELLEREAASVDDSADLHALRDRLNTEYDAYVTTYGPLNRCSWRRTGRIDPDSGEEKVARVNPPQGGFRKDPFASAVYALEHYDDTTQTAAKADIFRQRVIARPAPRLGADSPADALAICLDTYAEVRLPEVARLLGTEPEDARRQLGTLVFDEPGTDRLVPAPEYLSGNVRVKLAAAAGAAADEPKYAPNVAALKGVLPRDLGPNEIDGRLGAAWIHSGYVRDFLSETLQDDTIRVEHPGGSIWAVKSWQRESVLATSRWGTERYSAVDLAEALLQQRSPQVFDEGPNGERVLNVTDTAAAVEKGNELNERFSEWLWEDPERAKALARTYNDAFNAIVPRSYDDAKLSLPGLARAFEPRQHQVAAVARQINEPAVGLFHEVGAGKTAEIVMGAMELKRLGLVQKPAVVVPNHMLEQFSREWAQLYPQAKVLAASKEDLEKDQRRLFVAKCATGDWDGIVMTRGAFERIPMSVDAQKSYLQREVSSIEEMLSRAKADDSRLTLKRLERMKVNAEERIKDKLDGAKDPGITFEQLGIDYLFVDEAHAYKNLRTPSKIQGMAVDGSQRAQDLDMKLGWLRERHPRVATLATATPIANSMGEAYTMQRYLRPDLLAQAGVSDFDSWAATFGQLTTGIEVAPDGGKLRMQTRFAKFRNVPELLLQWKVSADIKTAEDLKLPVPKLAVRPSDGERAPETVVVSPSSELQAFVKDLAVRSDRVHSRMVQPDEDNMLKIASEGRAAALDLRLVGMRTDEPQKVTIAAERIASIYQQHRDDVFPGPDGTPHPRRGALQLVFADLGTPKTDGRWSAYEELREQLVERGVPREQVRFVHEAENDRSKAELFAAARDGRVAVLVGSTERMGVGTNVQLRAVALHHLDCPWRPADLAQREGRIIRQGNANEEIQILRYVTEGSFDAYSWQTVTRKAAFIGQVMRGRLDVREMEDVGDQALSYQEVKALATGNPLLLEHASAQAEVTRLERLQRSHVRNQDTLAHTARAADTQIARLEQRARDVDEALAKLGGKPPEDFRLTVGRDLFDKPGLGNEVLRRAVERELSQWAPSRTTKELGSYHGFPVTLERMHDPRKGTIALRGVPESDFDVGLEQLGNAALGTRVAHRLEALPSLRENTRADIGRLQAERARAEEERTKPFRHQERLDEARERLRTLEAEMARQAQPPPPPSVPVPPAEWRGSLPEAVRELQRALPPGVALVSGRWEEQPRIRVTSPERLLEVLAAAPVAWEGPDAPRVYAVRSDGTLHNTSVHNTATHRDEYLVVTLDTQRYPALLRSAVDEHFAKKEGPAAPESPGRRGPEVDAP